MKVLKKILIGLFIVVLLVVAAAVIIPVVFRDDIKAAIDKEIAKKINADVIFDVKNFSLTVFRHFPNITTEVKELGVFNRAPFQGVHLFVIERMDVEVNLFDVLFGHQLRVKGITLIRPQINIHVMKDGRANYNITFPSTDTILSKSQEPAQFSFGIDHWEIVDGEVVYDDQSLTYYLSLKGLNHSGSGDFTQDVFDLKTHTVADTVSSSFGAMELLTNKKVAIDATISISEKMTKYTFKENLVKVNDFGMSCEGWFKMNMADYSMDLAFRSPENSFKSLLSLAPGIYSKDFSKIETQGELSFSGLAKGTYSDKQIPAFTVEMKVSNGMFKYPELPTSVSNINMDLRVDNKDGVLKNTVVDLKKLHLDFGSNPVDARLLIQNLRDYRIDANLKAKLNLAELNKMFPMKGLEMRGIYSVNASVQGVYDSLRKVIPGIDATMSLTDGYVKSSQFPLPLEDLKFNSSIKNTSGKMAETTIAVNDFSMLLDKEKLTASIVLRNLDDYTWDLKASGDVDLEKMTKIFPLDGMSLSGNVKADLETKGKMSDVKAKRYDRLPTSGTASLKDFKFKSKSVAYVIVLNQADVAFDPKKIELKRMTGTIGKSDFDVKGLVTNYLGYVLNNETINGTVAFKSSVFDLNEFMTSSPTEATTTDTAALRVIKVPNNIDFAFNASIKTVKMMEYTMANASGVILVKDGVANLNGIKFTLLGGAFGVNGTYNTKDMNHPKYDFGLKIDNLSFREAANSFSLVKTFAPVAGLVNGKFGVDFKINGELKQNMTLNLPTVNGAGLITIGDASVTQSTLISGITALTKLDNTDNVSLQNVRISASIANGKLSVKPFDVKFGNYKTTIAGSTGLDGAIDYSLKMNVPAGKLGSQLQGFVNQYAGTNNSTSEIPVTIGLGGTYDKPKTTLVTQEQKQQVKEAVTKVAEQKGKEAIQNAVKGTQAEQAVKDLLESQKADPTTGKDTAKAKPVDPVNQLLQNKLQNLLKKKKN